MAPDNWQDVGPVEDLTRHELAQVRVKGTSIALSYREGEFRAISGACNHVGGPLGQGRLEGDYVVCPWHYWKYHHATGNGEPGFEEDSVPSYETKVEDGRLFVNLVPKTPRHKAPHLPHPLARPVRREEGPVRVLGLSTTVMDTAHPRYSGSDDLLETALHHAAQKLECQTDLIRLRDLHFNHCEGFYSKSARACTWPCSITQMNEDDQLDRVYEAVVHWADVIVVATPIRWGAASSLYFKMAERMNCIQNQVTTHDRVLIRNKVASFIIVGGQDNIQAVAGQMLGFFGELGFLFPQFPYVAHSRGWSAEDMERNVAFVQKSRELHEGAGELVERSVELARRLLASEGTPDRVGRGGRKAHRMEATEG
jgi:nitrite reductase/ring-hydroxylating ferredoxin subunit/multimeric flavodoxin WrbA